MSPRGGSTLGAKEEFYRLIRGVRCKRALLSCSSLPIVLRADPGFAAASTGDAGRADRGRGCHEDFNEERSFFGIREILMDRVPLPSGSPGEKRTWQADIRKAPDGG